MKRWCFVVTLAALASVAGREACADPIVSFSVSLNPVLPGQLIEFDGQATIDSDPTRTLTSAIWDFGDGQTTANGGLFVSHSYAAVGGYLASLTVENDLHEQSVATLFVNVIDSLHHAPVADAGGPYLVTLGSNFTLDGSGSSDLDPQDTLSYSWDLIEPITESGVIDASGVSAQLSADAIASVFGLGTFTLNLIVRDNFGLAGFSSTTLTIAAPAPPASVPEPSSVLLVGLGTVVLLPRLRERLRFGR